MVNRFEQSPAVVINDPKTIRHNMDKSYMWNLEQKGVRIIPTYQMNGNIRSLLKDHGRLIIKPRKGERGLDQLLISDEKEVEVLKGREGDYLVQKFMPDIRNGERSLVFLGLDYQHAIIKKPPQDNPDEHRCNESIGGSVSVYYPSEEEIGFARNVLESYNSLGFPVHFSRVDFMKDKEGPVLVEAELLNPSIFANYIGVGREYGDSIANYFHNLLESQPKSDLVRVGDDGNNLHS